jgi:hypothetical protein
MKNYKDSDAKREDVFLVGFPRIYVILNEVSVGHSRIVFEKQGPINGKIAFGLPVDTFYLNALLNINRRIEIEKYPHYSAGLFSLGIMGICYQVVLIKIAGSIIDIRKAFPELGSFKLFTPADIVRGNLNDLPDAITETALKIFTNYCLASADKDLIWLGKQLPEGALSLETKVWDSTNESINSKE